MYQEEAERVVALCASDVPCIPGAERPMESREQPVPSAGLELLVEEARLSPLTVIATGPATDVASLFLVAPESRENVRVVWLGGFGDEASYKVWQNSLGELHGRADILHRWTAEHGGQLSGGKELWDLACVAAVADPGAITSGPLAVPTLDAAGAHDFTQPGRKVDVVWDLDERRVLAGLMEALARHPERW